MAAAPRKRSWRAALEEDRGNAEAHFLLGTIYNGGSAKSLAQSLGASPMQWAAVRRAWTPPFVVRNGLGVVERIGGRIGTVPATMHV